MLWEKCRDKMQAMGYKWLDQVFRDPAWTPLFINSAKQQLQAPYHCGSGFFTQGAVPWPVPRLLSPKDSVQTRVSPASADTITPQISPWPLTSQPQVVPNTGPVLKSLIHLASDHRISMESVPWFLSVTTFRYHQQSRIAEDTTEPSFLSEKLISKHVCLWSQTTGKLHRQLNPVHTCATTKSKHTPC